MKTYVVNMKDAIHKFETIQRVSNLDPIRFIAKTPRDIEANTDKISSLALLFAPRVPIAIALSHLSLIEHILKTDTNSYALVLEDDATPVGEGADLKSKIREVVENTPSDWDIIRLHYFAVMGAAKHGRCEAGKNVFSNAAYIVRRKAIPTILSHKVHYHFDMQLNCTSLKIYLSPTPLFKTDESVSSTRGRLLLPYGTVKALECAEFWKGFNALRIPFVDSELTVESFIIIAIVVVIVIVRRCLLGRG